MKCRLALAALLCGLSALVVSVRAADAQQNPEPCIAINAAQTVGPWSKTMMQKCADRMNLISEHLYCGEKPHVYGELGTKYFLKDALGIAAGLHEYARQSDMIFMANYTQTVNVIGCIKTSKTAAASQ